MNAHAGDWVLIESKSVGRVVRRGEIVEVHGEGGTPPYLVRWTDTDHQSTYFPGPDARIITAEELAHHDEAERQRLEHIQEAIHHSHSTTS